MFCRGLRARRLLCAVAVLVGGLGVSAGLAAAGVMSWGSAVEVPGTAALNVADAATSSVTCASAGNCAAGGYYSDGAGARWPFVASEKSGKWSSAVQVPGIGALNVDGYGQVNAVSCGSAGNCSAGGLYTDGDGYQQPFVATEKNGVWGAAKELSVPNNYGAGVTSVSCRSATNCSAGGSYVDSNGSRQAFVVSERNGVWGKAVEVPGIGVLNADGVAEALSVSCATAGNCVAGGYYRDASNGQQAFLASERNGTWGKAIEVPGSAGLNVRGIAQVNSVSCTTVGNCSAGGYYTDKNDSEQAFIVTAKNGKWGKASPVKGLPALNVGGAAQVVSVSCVANSVSPSNCSAGGDYFARGYSQAFVVSEKSGVWGSAKELTVPNSNLAAVMSVSCGRAGNCAAAGYYGPTSGYQQAFVAGENNGKWVVAVEVPGTTALNVYGGAVNSVSCPHIGKCALGGFYHDASNYGQAFVTSP